jgi:transketolase C-terminal domain/subunit
LRLDLIKKNPNLIITTSDVSTSAGLDRFKNKYPEKLY